MKEILPFQLQNKNTYLFINKLNFKYIMLVNPQLIEHLSSNTKAINKRDDTYYKRKAEYLIAKLPQNDHLYFGRIAPEQIENAFLNINQIVLEVTDQCNLNCTYCGYGNLYGIQYNTEKDMTFPFPCQDYPNVNNTQTSKDMFHIL